MEYACLKCGLVQDRIVSKRRVDTTGHSIGCISVIKFHGYIVEWKCKDCGNSHQIESIPD